MAKFRGRKLILSNKDRDTQRTLRLDWRDPNMPVMLNCTDPLTGTYLKEFTSERAQYVSQIRMQMSHAPDWRNDPTYNMRRKPK
jgi:hypothetical protein